jgi:hypothetical protein
MRGPIVLRQISLQFKPEIGSFGLPLRESGVTWYKCREEFSGKYCASTTEMFYVHGQAAATSPFIARTEEIIGLAEMTPENELFPYELTVVRSTNIESVKSILPSRFWSRCPVRRSLLTLLLRCGDSYDPIKNNYEDALMSNYFLATSIEGVKRFLMGYTEFVGEWDSDLKKGWHSTFKDVTPSRVKTMFKRAFTADPIDCIITQ